MRKRLERQDAIKRIVRNERVKTQRALVENLKAEGFVCTQATVSRDITEMGLKKLPEGVYVLAEDLHLQRMVSDLVNDVRRSEKFVLVKASAGTAHCSSIRSTSSEASARTKPGLGHAFRGAGSAILGGRVA
jgi:transcriptional regulator of arginine metabolism